VRLSRLGLALSFVLLAISANADDQGAPPEYRIASEDVLQISVWQYAALTRSVRPDGKISLPLINDVQAAGLTARELQNALTEKLSGFVPNPEVSVVVLDIRSAPRLDVGSEIRRLYRGVGVPLLPVPPRPRLMDFLDLG